MWNVLNNESETQIENPWIVLADKALKGAFKDTPVFTGLCEVMGNAIERKMKNKCKRNLKYSEEFTSFLVILGGFSTKALDLFCQNLEGRTIQHLRRNSEDRLTDPDLCFENIARFKRLIDSIQYNGPVVVMTDITKLKSRLRYSPTFGCIIGSVFPIEETKINVYADIPNIISKIKNEKAIAKDVHAYMLQIPLPKFPPIAIALIPNKGNDNSKTISQLHKKLIQEIAFQLEIHILSIGSDDKQVDAAAYRTFCSANFKQCLTHDFQVKVGMEGTIIYLFIMGEIVDCYLNRTILPIERMRMAMTAYRDYYPQVPFLPWLHGSESCEHFFGVVRQINPDFDFAKLIQMLPKISQYSKALRNGKLNFDKERSVREGYLFDYTSELDKLTLEKLHLWPNDKQISDTIHHSYHLAQDLAEYAGMIQPFNISVGIDTPWILIESHEIDVSSSDVDKQSRDNNNDEYDLSAAIGEASLEMKQITETSDDNGHEFNDDFTKGHSQLDEIAKLPDNLYILNDGIMRKFHESYSSRPLERKFKIVGGNSRIITEGPNSIQQNMASHFVAYFTKNENPEQSVITQREKQWKDNRKNIATTLAQLHVQELAKSKDGKKSNKKNVQESLIKIPNIKTANITEGFPLIKGDYLFV
ncbi:hypothetical protein RclHR1_27250001 [Rhizophagus clarus]|uniref:Uncharacterized protein n=1 Tax=Rhizophagus clarus TaxID=94130 RepID=A0A2Z6RHF1_9GLOM|nr:hypothetical protein RclHR1_27250001 [Rhizophagus clarus]